MANNIIRSTVGFVLLNSKGQYLKITFRTTHTGNHSEVSFADSIDDADVYTEDFWQRQKRRLFGAVDTMDLIRVPAVLETSREVRLIQPSMPTAATPE